MKQTFFSLFCLGLLILTSTVEAQTASSRKRPVRQSGTHIKLADTLKAFNDISSFYIGSAEASIIDPCLATEVVIGFGNSVKLSDVDSAVGSQDVDASNQARVFQQNLQWARSNDFCEVAAVNDKCCTPSNQVDVSDTCTPLATKNCVLMGVRIQGCTSASDNC